MLTFIGTQFSARLHRPTPFRLVDPQIQVVEGGERAIVFVSPIASIESAELAMELPPVDMGKTPYRSDDPACRNLVALVAPSRAALPAHSQRDDHDADHKDGEAAQCRRARRHSPPVERGGHHL